MRKTRRSSLWNYLNQVGVLERGDEDEIRQAKKQYRQLYLKRYKQSYKRRNTDFTITCNPEEKARLIVAAHAHGLKPVHFLKKAAFAYCRQVYLVPHVEVMHSILQLLLRYETTIERVVEKDKGAWYKADRRYEELEQAVTAMREGVQNTLANPSLLETVIRQTLRKSRSIKPSFKKFYSSDSEKYEPQNGILWTTSKLYCKG